MIIVKHRNWFFAFTGAIVLAALISLFAFGLHLGTDFTGGTLVQVTYPQGRPAAPTLEASLNAAGFENYSLREANTNDYMLRAGNLTATERADLPQILSIDGANPATVD